MSTATWITGDSLEVLRAMPASSVDLVFTSPPFLALRSYLDDNDPAKVHEIGQEPTPGEYLDALLDVAEACRRVLAPHGSMGVELGDTYAGSGGAGGDYNADGLRAGQQAFKGAASRSRAIAEGRSSRPPRGVAYARGDGAQRRPHTLADWPNDKSLTLIPELFRLALAYGFNPLTGRETPRWRIRNVVRWVRPNPPVGALGDKFRPGTSDMVIATGIDEAGRTRYFDLDAVRTPLTKPDQVQRNGGARTHESRDPSGKETNEVVEQNPAGAPPLDWWEIPGKPYKGSHYATFPTALCTKPIEAMCPRRVCTVCGEPSRRLVEVVSKPDDGRTRDPERMADFGGERHGHRTREARTVGWSCCGHGPDCTPTAWVKKMVEVEQGQAADGKWYDLDELDGDPTATRTKRKRKTVLEDVGDCDGTHLRNGIVLDPFGGSGTTLAVATGHGRDAIGIDLDARNADLARDRIGPMFFTEATVDELWPEDGAA